MKYRLVNPGGEGLSSQNIPYKVLTRMVMVAWAALALLWIVNWVIARQVGCLMQCLYQRFVQEHRLWQTIEANGLHYVLTLGELLPSHTVPCRATQITRAALILPSGPLVCLGSSIFTFAFWEHMSSTGAY